MRGAVSRRAGSAWGGRQRLVDVAVAGGVAGVLALIASAELDGNEPGGNSGGWAYLAAVALGGLMLGRRRWARTTVGLTVFGLFAWYAAGFPPIGVAVPVAAALYSAAEAGHRRSACSWAFVALGVSVGFRLREGQDFGYVVLYDGTAHLALMGAAIALGELVRARRRIAALTERQIDWEAERRVHEHQRELSRELHDSIGHALTVAAIQANVARQESTRDPDATAAALDHVGRALSEALDELRGTVRNLRAVPAPSAEDVAELLETARAAGFEVHADLEQVRDPAPAHRLIREAVTNALRHSTGRRIDVQVRETGDELLIRIRDDGDPAAPNPGGTGLAGMRERVLALGGRFDAGPVESGWLVSAAIPTVREGL
ncbi:sensor histidine kinase [Actinoplanes couchii]|uniref:histidine kinase n=1 Tax=Actinoplanes couchii TaxID=403638 RepID=A0ABQ3X5D9_9ACTN|nr:histidine kinase [Actinoplanes couchii]MDR6325949.1 signal transduction histidine kinase [Actinoplanes couchii]GID53699.1 two-component sensor histidine kinase [Actinoplanes couchii]